MRSARFPGHIALVSLIAMAGLITSRAGAADSPPIVGKIVPQIGHSQAIRDIEYTKSGDIVVTGAGDSKIKLWSRDGRLLRTISVGQYKGLALSPDDAVIAVSKLGGTAELWSFEGERIRRLPKMNAMILDEIAFSPQGDYLVVCTASTSNDYCQLYHPNGTPQARIENPTNGQSRHNIKGIGFSSDGSTIYLAVGQHVYSYGRDGGRLGQFRTTDGFVAAMAVSPDGELIAIADSETSRNGSVPHLRLFTSAGELVAEHSGHPSHSIGFSQDGSWLVSGGWNNNRVLILDRTGREIHGFRVGRETDESPARIAISPDRNRIITAGKTIDPVDIRLWTADGSEAGRFRQTNSALMAMDVDARNGLIVTASLDDTIRYWSMDGRLLRHHPANYESPNLLAIAPNGQAFVSGGTEITVWDDRGNALASVPVHKKGARALRFTPDSRFLITGGIDGYVNLVPLDDEGQSKRFVAHDGEDVTAIATHPDGRRFATGSIWERFRIWDIEGKQLADFRLPATAKAPFSTLHEIQFTPDGRELVVNTTRRNEEIRFYNLDGSLSRQIKLPTRNTYENGAMAISPDSRWLAVAVNRQIGLWDLATLELKKALNGHSGWIGEMKFTEDGRYLVSGDTDGIVRVWNVDTSAGYALLSAGDEWAIFTDDGYFDASRYGGDMISFVSGMQGYSVDQFAVRFNRPDVLYQRLGIASKEVIDHFQAYYKRRLTTFGSGEPDALTVPTVRILSHRQRGKFVEVELASDTKSKKKAFLQIYANDVPTYAGRGKSIDGGRQIFTEQVELTSGKNKIEASVITPDGIESLRVPIHVEYDEPVHSDLFFVGLGVSDYRDSELDLSYADKDIQDMGSFLQRYEGQYENVHLLQLTNEDATRESLERVEHFLASASVDDTVIFLVSGHGGYEYGETSTYYFLPHEADARKLSKTAIPYDRLEGVLSGIKPRRKLLMLDTCQSGEFDAASLRAIEEVAGRRGLSVRSRQRLISEVISEPRAYLYQRDRYIYNNLARRTGAIVFSSSLANEASLETSQFENGVFTRAVLETLSSQAADADDDGFISVSELEFGVKLFVARATGDLQHPSIERENIYQDVRLPLMR